MEFFLALGQEKPGPANVDLTEAKTKIMIIVTLKIKKPRKSVAAGKPVPVMNFFLEITSNQQKLVTDQSSNSLLH